MPPARSSGDRLTGDLARAAASWVSLVLALGLSGVALAAARDAGASGDAARAVPAAVVLSVTAPLVLLAHGRSRWQSVLALRRPVLALAGAAVGLGAAGLVLLADHLAGGAAGFAVTGVDPWRLVQWLVVALLLAAAMEAVPQELALRGGVFGGLRGHLPGWLAGLVTTGAAVAAPACSVWATAQLGEWMDVAVPPATFAPAGQDPVSHAVLLAALGTVLLLVRSVVGSVWACVGFHLAFGAVSGLLLGDPATTGLPVQTGEGAELLVVAHLAVTAAVLGAVLLRRRGGRR
ncbi:CPBP family glutamic-type intramembrane protease [Quadrisphaera setariae]|uniref:CAAX prenyl protease 2/Lysostaphin resistance protein A-like domain-containing protein n=1 Tax=Quadrisphaera setariae TaxID=2593304 RepID=A0A5C8ZEI4_9ACTN|nr:CPBP family glutamic-type intramembrane protease [Quadrisphaera setariae]TXR55326.1 hypothetical protein FMM08_15795 [Quadrisphaera setariae]